ncbi:MAG: PilT/PilU family type 4a pilus ATPase [Acidobacteriota bacterium]
MTTDFTVSDRLLPDPELDRLVRSLNDAARTGQVGDETPPTEPPETPSDPPPAPVDTPGRASVTAPPSPSARRWPLPPETAEGQAKLRELLTTARSTHASDLLLVAGSPPQARVNGRLEPLEEAPLSRETVGALAAALVPRSRRDETESTSRLDLAFTKPTLGRFRCNVHRERGRWAAAIRLFPEAVPSLSSLQLPEQLERLAQREHGLLLVTGATGAGKSTTLAAVVRSILGRRRVHLITIEDPVEYEHRGDGSVVEQVEVGSDTTSFADALRSTLRQDPDVILIGEMRDAETMSVAITAAETGHLVLATLHTGDAPQTVHRIVDTYPGVQQDAVRAQLAASLTAIASQCLLPRRDGRGRVPAMEILVATHAVRNLIRTGRVEQLRSQIGLEQHAGMLDLDQGLARLVQDGLVDREVARNRAREPEVFDSHLA